MCKTKLYQFSFAENKLLNETTGKSNTVFINVLWEFFKLTRYLSMLNL